MGVDVFEPFLVLDVTGDQDFKAFETRLFGQKRDGKIFGYAARVRAVELEIAVERFHGFTVFPGLFEKGRCRSWRSQSYDFMVKKVLGIVLKNPTIFFAVVCAALIPGFCRCVRCAPLCGRFVAIGVVGACIRFLVPWVQTGKSVVVVRQRQESLFHAHNRSLAS